MLRSILGGGNNGHVNGQAGGQVAKPAVEKRALTESQRNRVEKLKDAIAGAEALKCKYAGRPRKIELMDILIAGWQEDIAQVYKNAAFGLGVSRDA